MTPPAEPQNPEDVILPAEIREGTELRSETTGNVLKITGVYIARTGATVVEIEENGSTREMTAQALAEAIESDRIAPHSYETKKVIAAQYEARWGKEHRNGDVTRVEVRDMNGDGYCVIAVDVVDGEQVAETEVAWGDDFELLMAKAETWMAQNPKGVDPEQGSGEGGMLGGLF
jgi:hypothetical protein